MPAAVLLNRRVQSVELLKSKPVRVEDILAGVTDGFDMEPLGAVCDFACGAWDWRCDG